MADQLERGQQGSREGRHDPLPGLQSEGVAEISLALVHGQTSTQEAAALHRQPPVDAERLHGHHEDQREVRLRDGRGGQSFTDEDTR